MKKHCDTPILNKCISWCVFILATDIMCTATIVQPNNNSPITFRESRISTQNAVCCALPDL